MLLYKRKHCVCYQQVEQLHQYKTGLIAPSNCRAYFTLILSTCGKLCIVSTVVGFNIYQKLLMKISSMQTI